MKVLMVGNAQSVKGGIATVISQFINHNWSEQIKLKFIPTYTDKNWIIKIFFFTKAYIRILLNFIFFKPDIVHIHMSYKGSFTRANLIQNLSQIFNVKNIIHLHGSQFDKWYVQCGENKRKKIRRLIKRANIFIVLGNEWQEKIKNIEPNSNIKIIQNSIHIPKNNIKAKYNKNCFNLLYLGVLVERKGVSDLIDAINILVKKQEFQNAKLLIAGSGEQSEFLQRKVKELNLSQYIDFLGWVNKEEKKDLLLKSQLLVLPSYNEGLPMCILEAMSYGLPILSTNVGDVSEAVKEGKNGFLIEAGNVNELTENIKKIITIDETDWLKLSDQSIKFIIENFSDKKYFFRFEEIYKAI